VDVGCAGRRKRAAAAENLIALVGVTIKKRPGVYVGCGTLIERSILLQGTLKNV